MWEKTNLTNREGYEKGLRGYADAFGGGIQSILKPFTTLFVAIGLPHYQKSIYTSGSVAPSSYVFDGADASGLNPFGPFTLGEGIIHGSGNLVDLDTSIDPSTVRTMGLKTPMTYVGWGYDQFGYPSPNPNRAWEASGVFSPSAPSTSWASSGFVPVSRGNQVPYSLWQAGPLDLRWDINRKIWTAPQSVYAARVLQAYSSGIIAPSGTPVFSSTITYDVTMYDGVANRIKVTGVYHVGPQPIRQTADGGLNIYKKHPLPSGAHVLLMHGEVAGKPQFVMYAYEEPGTLDCASTDVATSLFAAPIGNLSLSQLVSDPLTVEYGGVGFNSYAAYDILVGDINGSGDLLKLGLVAGTGIDIIGTTGTLTIQLSSGVSFITASGVNNNITELQGLTTPLTIAQGGTGSSVKNFIDLGTSQSASGVKYFTSGLRLPSGSFSSPALAPNSYSNYGIYFPTEPRGVGIAVSGFRSLFCTDASGIKLYNFTHFDPSDMPLYVTGNNFGIVTIDQASNGTFADVPLQMWRQTDGLVLGSFSSSGHFQSRQVKIQPSGLSVNSTALHIDTPTGFIGSSVSMTNSASQEYFNINADGTSLSMGIDGNKTTLLSPTGDRSINLASGITVDVLVIASGAAGLATGTMTFIHGLLVGYAIK